MGKKIVVESTTMHGMLGVVFRQIRIIGSTFT